MRSETPKQYLPLAGRTVIEWSLQRFLERPDCTGVVVVLSEHDRHWSSLGIAQHPKVAVTVGGNERAGSVLAGLRALNAAAPADWVAVHDAARPCLSQEDLERLIAAVRDDEVGGLLATRLADTLKRADADERVAQTVPREGLWRALTPQMFRHDTLVRALQSAADRRIAVTDEAQAVELLGLRPRLVSGSADNLKITVPEDFSNAMRILAK